MTLVRRVLARGARTRASQLLVDALDSAFRPPAGVFAVLTYHRVDEPAARPWLYPGLVSATPEQFEDQMRLLGRRYRPVSMDDLLAATDGARALPPRAVHVTFDDAYSDFAANAWPILGRLGIPATLFVPTGYPDASDTGFWWDRVWRATRARAPDEARARASAAALMSRLKSMPHGEAMVEVERYCRASVTAAGEGAGSRSPDVLGWDALRRLAAEGVFLGGHSRTHPLLSRVAEADLVSELEGARADLGREIPGWRGAGVVAYPAGDYNPGVLATCARLGFRLGFTTRRGANRLARTDPLTLRRINVSLRSDPRLIRTQLVLAGAQRRLSA